MQKYCRTLIDGFLQVDENLAQYSNNCTICLKARHYKYHNWSGLLLVKRRILIVNERDKFIYYFYTLHGEVFTDTAYRYPLQWIYNKL